MNDLFITAVNSVTSADVATARLGTRFRRMDQRASSHCSPSNPLRRTLTPLARERIAIVLAARTGSLPTDVATGGGATPWAASVPHCSPHTLPSAALGEIAIRHRLTGPNLCFVGASDDVPPRQRS